MRRAVAGPRRDPPARGSRKLRLLDEPQRRRSVGHQVAREVAWVEHLHQHRDAVWLRPLRRPTQPLRKDILGRAVRRHTRHYVHASAAEPLAVAQPRLDALLELRLAPTDAAQPSLAVAPVARWRVEQDLLQLVGR
eukprot:scaffold115860_cov62-Phaeocystis_antarctica.AAC.5